MKVNLKALITGTTLISLPAFLFWGSVAISFLFKQNAISQFYGSLPVSTHALFLVVLPALVLLAITITKQLFEINHNAVYMMSYNLLRKFSYFTIISSILLFALSTVFSRG